MTVVIIIDGYSRMIMSHAVMPMKKNVVIYEKVYRWVNIAKPRGAVCVPTPQLGTKMYCELKKDSQHGAFMIHNSFGSASSSFHNSLGFCNPILWA